jgi:RNA 3'-terminal phosphate cyclase (ATP)
VEISVSGRSQLQGLHLLARGQLQEIWGLAVVTQLPQSIPQRLAQRAQDLLQEAGFSAQIQVLPARGPAAGAGFFLIAEYGNSRAGFSALGRRGLPAESVAKMAVAEFLEFDSQQAPVDAFLGDQLLLPLALAQDKSQYRTAKITRHLTTNAWVIQQFCLADITIDSESQVVEIIPF